MFVKSKDGSYFPKWEKAVCFVCFLVLILTNDLYNVLAAFGNSKSDVLDMLMSFVFFGNGRCGVLRGV